jgi:acetylornithine deacetylase
MPDTLSPLELMTKLISFPTVSRDSNLPLIDWVEDYLASHGITSHRFYDDTEGRSVEKAALFAHVGPEVEGGIVLSGHTDVVPVDGQPWDTDPWCVTEKDGKYFGRGTCDMKGFDALAIWALVEAHKRGTTRPLQIALSFDEEVGCTGAPPMIERIMQTLPKASAVMATQPTCRASRCIPRCCTPVSTPSCMAQNSSTGPMTETLRTWRKPPAIWPPSSIRPSPPCTQA